MCQPRLSIVFRRCVFQSYISATCISALHETCLHTGRLQTGFTSSSWSHLYMHITGWTPSSRLNRRNLDWTWRGPEVSVPLPRGSSKIQGKLQVSFPGKSKFCASVTRCEWIRNIPHAQPFAGSTRRMKYSTWVGTPEQADVYTLPALSECRQYRIASTTADTKRLHLAWGGGEVD